MAHRDGSDRPAILQEGGMSSRPLASPAEEEVSAASASDAQIVERCLEGDQDAWRSLLARYRALIHSIPFKYGASPEDAADIFQAVSLELFSALAKLREPRALRAWLMQVTAHKCFQWKQTKLRRAENDLSQIEDDPPASLIVPPTLVEIEVSEREERLRQAIARLPDRCREVIQMLFYVQPPRSYNDVAEALGLARGSVPAIRARSLKRLQQILEEMDD
jgi:RNA polymerase sigma factor (sigma-70 family)